MHGMNNGKWPEEHSDGDLDNSREVSWHVKQQPLQRRQSESRDPESSSKIDPPLNELGLISTVDGRSLSSVDFDSELPSYDSRGHQQQVSESRDPHYDGRSDNVHAQPKGSECIDVNKICQEMEQAMEHRFRRLDETWNQIPLIIEQLQRHVDDTKNMDSSVFQMGTRSIRTSNEAETAMSTFSTDEALNLSASTSKELDNSIEASFPKLRAYVSHLESTSTSAIAELLVDEMSGSLTVASSQEAASSFQSWTESFSEDLILLAELSFKQNDDKADDIQTRDTEESVPACITIVGQTRQPLIEEVTTSQPAFACRITWVENPTTSMSREEIHSQARLSLMQNDDNITRGTEESVPSCMPITGQTGETFIQQVTTKAGGDQPAFCHHITTAESPTTSVSKEEIDSQAKLSLLQSEDNVEDIQIQTRDTAEWERHVLSLAPSDETANSTQSCTESMSLSVLRAEIYCQEANLCFIENADDGIPTQTDPELSKIQAEEQNRQTSHQDLTWSQMLDGLNAKWEHACLNCDRCLSIALTGSLPVPS